MASATKKKPFKVRKGKKTHGVVVENFEELKTKGCKKLNISDAMLECIALEDGTIVDGDYFQTIPKNTVLIFKEDTRTKMQRLVDHVEAELSGLTIEEVRHSLDGTDGYNFGKKFIKSYLQDQENNEAEERKDDATWFKDVRPNYKTKSHYMRDKAKVRIRNYFNVTKKVLLPKAAKNKNDSVPGNTTSKERTEDVIKAFQQTLKKNDYHGKLFDRSDDTGQRICDKEGLFCCQGLFGNQSTCTYDHEINPYLQWQFVLEFSSWNLDHQIEKSKEVIPELKKAIEKSSKKVNVDYFYDLLFTMKNLKLVHTVCHDKRDHGLKVDPEKVHLPS